MGWCSMSNPIANLDWVNTQTNSALQSEHEVGYARVLTLEDGYNFHNERWKNWDNYAALHHTFLLTSADDLIVDAGACRDPKYPSAYLPTLAKRGYRDLMGVNLDEKTPYSFESGVVYRQGNIEHMGFLSTKSVAFLACLSTIEHGVNLEKFFHEAGRVLQRNGHLFVSFDYWKDPVDTRGMHAFGVPIKIFDEADVRQMVELAYANDMDLTSPFVPDCRDRVVKWMGLEYTFANLLLRKK